MPQGRKRIAIVVLGLGVVAACGTPLKTADASRSEPASTHEGPWRWSSAPEGSFVYLSEPVPEIPDAGAKLVRCWRLNNAFDCLVVQQIGRGGAGTDTMYNAFRIRPDRLPSSNAEAGYGQGRGYLCTAFEADRLLIAETIAAGPNASRTQSVFLRGKALSPLGSPRPWTAADVNDSLRAAGGNVDHPYFACAVMAQVIADGGLASLSSEDARYSSLML
jgi:hypothetical protein